MRHHVQIDVGDRPGVHQLLIDGHDVSKAVTSLTLNLEGGGSPELHLRLDNFDLARYDHPDTKIVLTDPTRDALIALGWTPPAEP